MGALKDLFEGWQAHAPHGSPLRRPAPARSQRRISVAWHSSSMPQPPLPPATRTGRAPLGAAALAALAVVAALFVGLYCLFVGTARGQWVDEQALIGALQNLNGSTTRRASLAILDQLPMLVGVACTAGLLLSAWLRRDVVVPLIAAASAGLAVAATQILKHQLLDRPNLGISAANVNSFPSGHTTVAAAAVFALLLAAPRSARPWLALCGALAAAATGAATVVMGWHRPSDVVAAFLVCAFCALLGAWAIGMVQAGRLRAAGLPARGPAIISLRERARYNRQSLRAGLPQLPTTGRQLLGILLAFVIVISLGTGTVLLSQAWQLDNVENAPSPAYYTGVGLALILGAALVLFPAVERFSYRFLLPVAPDSPASAAPSDVPAARVSPGA